MSNQSQLPKEYSPLENLVLETREYAGEITIEVDAKHILEVCKTMKEKFGFNYLADISAIDWYTEEKRFGVTYNIANLTDEKRLRITCRVEENEPTLDTVCDVWPAANWFEREAFDMMGIRFNHHPDLRRIFMPEDFEYYPLRKEFPLIGIPGSIQMPDKVPPKGYN